MSGMPLDLERAMVTGLDTERPSTSVQRLASGSSRGRPHITLSILD